MVSLRVYHSCPYSLILSAYLSETWLNNPNATPAQITYANKFMSWFVREFAQDIEIGQKDQDNQQMTSEADATPTIDVQPLLPPDTKSQNNLLRAKSTDGKPLLGVFVLVCACCLMYLIWLLLDQWFEQMTFVTLLVSVVLMLK